MRLSNYIRFKTYGLIRWCGKSMLALLFTASMASAAEVTIVALGDSLTQGYGLPEQQGFVPVLQDWLTDQGLDVTIKNAGVSGDTSSGGLERVDWALHGEVHGMILAFGGNDMLRGFPPELLRNNLAQIIEVAQARDIDVLLVGMRATLNYGQDYKTAFDAVYPSLADEFGVDLYPDFIGAISRDRSMAEIQDFMQGDGLHPTAEGVEMIVDEMGPVVLGLVEGN